MPNGQVQKKEEAAPSEVPKFIPKPGKKIIEEKYDLTVNAYMKNIDARLKKDVASLNKKTAPAVKKGDTDAFWAAVEEWLEDDKNADSPLQYVYLKDEYFDLKTGKLKPDAVKNGIKDELLGPVVKKVKGKEVRKASDFKKMFVDAVDKSGEKTKFASGDTAYKDESLNVEDGPLYISFALFFAEHTAVDHDVKKLAKNELPVVITYDKDKEKINFSFPESFRLKEEMLKGG